MRRKCCCKWDLGLQGSERTFFLPPSRPFQTLLRSGQSYNSCPLSGRRSSITWISHCIRELEGYFSIKGQQVINRCYILDRQLGRHRTRVIYGIVSCLDCLILVIADQENVVLPNAFARHYSEACFQRSCQQMKWLTAKRNISALGHSILPSQLLARPTDHVFQAHQRRWSTRYTSTIGESLINRPVNKLTSLKSRRPRAPVLLTLFTHYSTVVIARNIEPWLLLTKWDHLDHCNIRHVRKFNLRTTLLLSHSSTRPMRLSFQKNRKKNHPHETK